LAALTCLAVAAARNDRAIWIVALVVVGALSVYAPMHTRAEHRRAALGLPAPTREEYLDRARRLPLIGIVIRLGGAIQRRLWDRQR